MRKHTKAIVTATIAVLLCLLLVLPASANSAQTYWEGVSASGVLITEGECPIVVEHETLTFDIAEFPSPYGSVEGYDASVTAAYTFYNPSDMTVTAKLLFPFGVDPYYMERYDPEKGEYMDPDYTEKYGAQVDGTAVQTTLRHSYWNGTLYDFDPKQEIAKLYDGYRTDHFLTYDLPVQVYTYQVTGVDHQAYRSARAATYIDNVAKDTRILIDNMSGWKSDDAGNAGWAATYASYSEIVVYVFGQDVGELEWTIFEDGSLENEIEGSVKMVGKNSTTFGELAMQKYDPETGVADHDWFNAVIAQLDDSERLAGCLYGDMYTDWDISKYLLQWYEYEITLTPEQRLTNTVTAPLYPNIDQGYEPATYSYEYFLTPASLWKEFGTLDIYVNTPYYMVTKWKGNFSIAPDKWTRTDEGYELHLEGLPEQDLIFTLSESEDPEMIVTAWTILGYFLIAFVVLSVLTGLISIIVILLCLLLFINVAAGLFAASVLIPAILILIAAVIAGVIIWYYVKRKKAAPTKSRKGDRPSPDNKTMQK